MSQIQRSNIMKMLKEEVPEDRKIETFPRPYKLEYTPYHTLSFSEITYKTCLEEKINWLKLSKVIVIGDISVGKTSIVNRFCRKMFDSNYKATIGVDFEIEKFAILNVPFSLQIWDTAGQERFKSIAQSYYRGAQVILIVFDFTSMKTLSHSKVWLKEALMATSSCPFIFLVGSKTDLVNEYCKKNIEVQIRKVAREMNAEYWAVSSKTGKNINNLFCRLAAICFEDSVKRETEIRIKEISIGTNLVSIDKKEKTSKVKCQGFNCVN